ncbi:MAG: LCP family protein [Oscillospiraceae bacterium]|nr:LCP family protein [Oscillospiraceae bacterium]
MLSSLRNFFLALFISLLLFGTIGYFIVKYVNTNITPDITGTTTETSDNNTDTTPDNNLETTTIDNTDIPDGDSTVFSALLVGVDAGESQDNAKSEADTIIMLNINAITKTIMISPLSCDMKVDAKGYTLRLGAVYAEYGINTLLAAVKSYTGLKMDYYCVVNYDTIKSVFDILGDINYNVPMDMYYKPLPYDDAKEKSKPPFDPDDPDNPKNQSKPEIDLKAGQQLIDGEEAIELLRYKGYAAGNEERTSVQIDFIKEFLRQKITLENLSKAQDIYNAIQSSAVNTNIDAKTFNSYTDLIFSLSTAYQTPEVLQYPGDYMEENGVMFYVPRYTDALTLYSAYRKQVVPAAGTTTTAAAAQNTARATNANTDTTGATS